MPSLRYILRAASRVDLYSHGGRISSDARELTWDMSRVLITQMGFVANVEQAPAVTDADMRASQLLS